MEGNCHKTVEQALGSRIVHALRDGRWDLLAYSIWTRLMGLDLNRDPQQEINIDLSRSHEYADSGGPDLIRVLKLLNISISDRIVDLGSGKGGAMFAMSRFSFSEILGIELSSRLITIARQNAAKLQVTNIDFICSDASEYTDFDRFTYVYMFNPFPADVVNAVMRNLAASIARHPRKLTLIYKYPGCPDKFIDEAFLIKKTRFCFKGSHPFSIYTTNHRLL